MDEDAAEAETKGIQRTEDKESKSSGLFFFGGGGEGDRKCKNRAGQCVDSSTSAQVDGVGPSVPSTVCAKLGAR